MSSSQTPKISKKDVSNAVSIALEVTPIVVFVSSLISLMSAYGENEFGFFVVFMYISSITYHALKAYKDMQKLNLKNDPIIKRIWLNKHFHFCLLDLGMIFTHKSPLLYVLDVVILSFVKVLTALDKHISKSTNTNDSSLRSIYKSAYIPRISGALEIFLCPYLFFYGLFTFNGGLLLAFVIDFILFDLFAYLVFPGHKWVYQQIAHNLYEIANKNRDAGQYIRQALQMIGKLHDFGLQLYPVSFLGQVKAAVSN